MMVIKQHWKILVCILILVLGGLGYWQYQQSSNKTTQLTQLVTRGDVYETLTVSGSIDAEEKAVLQFQTGGLLTWVGVKEGDTVKKKQALARLDSRTVQKNLEIQLNNYMTNRWDFEQTRDDNKSNIASNTLSDELKRTLEKSQFSLNNAVLAVELQDLALQYATLYAPFDGIITHIATPVPGVNISAAGATFSIINPQSLHFDLSVDQADVTLLSEGQKMSLVLDSFPDATLSGSIDRISFTPDTEEINTVYTVVITLDETSLHNLPIRIGMTGDATFVLKESRNTLTLPLRFIKEDSQGSYVLTTPQKVRTPVETGLIGESLIEVRGLPEGTVVYD